MNSQDSKRSNYPKNNKSKNAKRKNFRMKNLSPAKKFRLRLRLEKFQKRWQSREEYFEHDTRDNVQNKKNSNSRKRKYYNNADNRNKSKKIKRAPNNALILKTEANEILSKIDTANLTSGNAKSTFLSSHETTKTFLNLTEEDAKKNNHVNSPTLSETMKCCCHCTCARASKKLRKPRRKLSSPYLGDFDALHYSNSKNNNNNAHNNCSNTATKLTVMTTTQQQQHHHHHNKYIESSAGSCSHFLHEQPKIIKYVAQKVNIEKKSSIEKKKLRNGKRFKNLCFLKHLY